MCQVPGEIGEAARGHPKIIPFMMVDSLGKDSRNIIIESILKDTSYILFTTNKTYTT